MTKNQQPKVHEKYTQERKVKNDASLGSAEHHTELWDAEEVALLEGFWGTVPLEEIAETLGRTIEACRQKHYTIRDAMVTRAEDERIKATKANKAATLWEKGYTSLEDMGY